MSPEEINELSNHLKLQTAVLTSTNLILGALISVIPREQYLALSQRYLLDTEKHNENLLASNREDAKEWYGLMGQIQQQFLGQIAATRNHYNPSEK